MLNFRTVWPKRRKTIAIIIVLCVVVAGISTRLYNQYRLAAWTQDQATPNVSTIHPAASAAGGLLTLPASLQALNSAPIYARTSGYVKQWLVDIGDNVRSGQTLALLDAPEVQQQLAAAEADYQTARANQLLAQTTAKRWTTMLAKDAVSKQEADEKLGDLAAKTAVANAARANMDRLRTMAGYTRIVAPFDGTITTRSVQVGALINADNATTSPLFTVSDVSRIRAYVRVPQAYSAQVHVGTVVNLTLPEYPSRTFPATVTRTADAVDPASGTLLVELQADNHENALRPGSYAQANFPLQAVKGRVTLPPSALVISERGTQVALLGRDNRAILRTIKIGRDLGKVVEINDGLTVKDVVIDSPPESLQTGDAVRVVHSAGEQVHAAKK